MKRFGRNQKRRLREAAAQGRAESLRAASDLDMVKHVLVSLLGHRTERSALLGDPPTVRDPGHYGRTMWTLMERAEERIRDFREWDMRALDREVVRLALHEVETTVDRDFIRNVLHVNVQVGDLAAMRYHLTEEALAYGPPALAHDIAEKLARKLSDFAFEQRAARQKASRP